jgi:hypothetical protein
MAEGSIFGNAVTDISANDLRTPTGLSLAPHRGRARSAASPRASTKRPCPRGSGIVAPSRSLATTTRPSTPTLSIARPTMPPGERLHGIHGARRHRGRRQCDGRAPLGGVGSDHGAGTDHCAGTGVGARSGIVLRIPPQTYTLATDLSPGLVRLTGRVEFSPVRLGPDWSRSYRASCTLSRQAWPREAELVRDLVDALHSRCAGSVRFGSLGSRRPS